MNSFFILLKRVCLSLARRVKWFFLKLYFRIHFAFIESRWTYSQKDYVKWTHTTLPKEYIKQIQRLGKMFMDFIGNPKRCLDVGCGNGLLGGMTYREIGYCYLNKPAIGVDPLQLEVEMPSWLSEYTRGICENLAFKPEVFDTIVLATTLDHIENVGQCFDECKRVLRKTGTLNIWLTCIKDYSTSDLAHPNRFTKANLELMLDAHKWHITKTFVERFSDTGDTVFIKAIRQ